jgi:hypothetical protein
VTRHQIRNLTPPAPQPWTVWVDPHTPHMWGLHAEPGTSTEQREGRWRYHIDAATRTEAARAALGKTLFRLAAEGRFPRRPLGGAT